MKKILHFTILTFLVIILLSCSAHVHRVGNGPQGGNIQEARQWYALFGLIPINNVDTNQIVPANVEDYEIKTETSFIDIIINIFTGYITVYSRTVTVRY